MFSRARSFDEEFIGKITIRVFGRVAAGREFHRISTLMRYGTK